jgi:hypothetical protein
MDQARPLPTYLVQRYHGWKATGYAENQAWYRHLASCRPSRRVVASMAPRRLWNSL